jgi:hypothetical protein
LLGLQRIVGFALIAALAAMLAACSGAPPSQAVAADDDMLCRYAAGSADTPAYRQCRARIEGHHARERIASATHIDVTPANAFALVRSPTSVAVCSDKSEAACPAPSDITGSIPAQRKDALPKP